MNNPSVPTPTEALGIDFQSAQYGPPVPVAYGQNKVAGNCIWYGDFKATPQSSSAGKGGGSQTTGYTYSASFELVLCEGPGIGVANIYQGSTTTNAATLGGTVFSGAAGQAPWGHLTGTAALGYSLKALFAIQNMSLGGTASLPNLNFEVQGLKPFGGGIVDANPSDVLNDLCTDANHGLGFSFLGSLTQYSNYCVANGIFVSPVYDTQSTGSRAVDDLLKYTNTLGYYSEGLFKLTPLGDTSVTGNGVTYTPNVTPVVDLGSADLLADSGAPAVKITRKAPQDCLNLIRLQYKDRAFLYHTVAITASIDEDLNANGARTSQDETVDMITTAAVARTVGQNLVQREFYIRNQFEFELSWRWCWLEPTDLVTLTDPNTGLNKQPVRILEIDEDEHGRLKLTAEEFPQGVAHVSTYGTQAASGTNLDTLVDPGAITAPYIFRGPGFLVNGASPEIWCALDGGANWAGCNAYLSLDGTSYTFLKSFAKRSRYGTLTLPAWPGAATVEVVGNLIQDSNGNTQRVSSVTGDAKTGGSAPAWATTLNATTTDNHVTWTLVALKLGTPGAPTLAQVASGALAATTYFARVTWVDAYGRETLAGTEASLAVSLNNVLKVTQPASPPAGAVQWKVYVSNTAGGGSGHETAQATVAIATTTWQEPNTGLVAGAAMPASDTTGLFALLAQADPDATNIPSMLLNNGEQLLGGTQADADNFVTLAMVDTEVISYKTATLAAGPSYQLSYLRRNGYNSTNAAHLPGAPFVRLDDNILRLPVDPSLIGTTVYLKFLSINPFGRTPRSLASETAYQYVVGTNVEWPDVPVRPTNLNAQPVADGNRITWTNPNPPAVGSTSVEFCQGWTAFMVGATNQYLIDANGNTQQLTAGAGSQAGGSVPAWSSTPGNTTVDGGLTWTCRAVGVGTGANNPFTEMSRAGPTQNSTHHGFLNGLLFFYRARTRGVLAQSGWSAYTALVSSTGRHGLDYTANGTNLMPLRWAMFFLNNLGPQSTFSRGSIGQSGQTLFGYNYLRYTQLVAHTGQPVDLQLLQANEGTTNLHLLPRKYIFSMYISNATTVDVTSLIAVFVDSGGTSHGNTGALHKIGTSNRYFGAIDLSASTVQDYYIQLQNSTNQVTGDILDINAVMVEVQNGYGVLPSPFAWPAIYWADTGDVLGGIQGSTPNTTPSFVFTIATTTTSITFSWGAVNLKRADASSTSISTGSQAITGLAASTSYWFYPYYDEILGTIAFVLGSGHGSPAAAWIAASANAVQQQGYLGRAQLSSGGIKVTTPASGTGNGTGGGNSCLHPETRIDTRFAFKYAGELVEGDEVRTTAGWGRVSDVRRAEQDEWVELQTSDGRRLTRTPTHLVRVANGADGRWCRVRDLRLGDLLVGEGGLLAIQALVCAVAPASRVSFTVEGHEFYASEGGVLEHNTNQKP